MPGLRIRSVLAASDLSRDSDHLILSAGVIALAAGADLHVVHAFQFPRLSRGVTETFQEHVANSDHALLEQLHRAAPLGTRIGSHRVSLLSPFRAILQRAEEVAADLIVLGPHGEHTTE